MLIHLFQPPHASVSELNGTTCSVVVKWGNLDSWSDLDET